MNIREIESAVHEALDAGDIDTVERYAEHCAEGLCELGESLCLAIIGTDYRAWASILAVVSQKSPALADSLEAIEEHITRQRAAFIEKRAQQIDDQAEHDAMCRAEVNAEFKEAV